MSGYRVLTLNIHKGFSPFNRRMVIHDLRNAIRSTHADLVFLQEVGWQNEIEQAEYLADQVWSDFAYGKNSVYDGGHHGNAILSRYNFNTQFNTDISSSRIERRGFLYGSINLPCGPLHTICLHLSLRSSDRRIQATAIRNFIEALPSNEPVILAGDFNDWDFKMPQLLETPLRFQEAFRLIHGKEAKTFPSFFPLLSLDRVYVRGMQIQSAQRLNHADWPRLSDHLGLIVEVERC